MDDLYEVLEMKKVIWLKEFIVMLQKLPDDCSDYAINVNDEYYILDEPVRVNKDHKVIYLEGVI
jgi:hypothetical protein